jgi:hypothetical protein
VLVFLSVDEILPPKQKFFRDFLTDGGHVSEDRRGDPRSPAEKLCFSDFPKEYNRMFRLTATDFALAKSAGDQ